MKAEGNPSAARAEWKKGWPVVVAAAAGMGLTPLMIYPMGLFIGPLEAEFGWSRTLITSGLTINAVIGVIFAPMMGVFIDRFGPRRIAIPGSLLFCIAFACLAFTGPSPVHWWSLWVMVAIGSLMIKPTVWTAAIASRFNASRGMALALMLCGASLNGAIIPSVAGFLIDTYGWRWGYIGLAALLAGISIPLLVLFFYGATDLARTRSSEGHAPVDRSKLPGLDVRDALRSRQFFQLAAASSLIIFTITTTTVHFVPLVSAQGLDRMTAAGLASTMGVLAVAARLVTGSMLDRFNGTIIGGIMFALPSLAFAGMMVFDGSLPLAIGIAVVIGVCIGAEMEIASYLASRFFGMRNFGTLFGIIVGLISLAAGVGPVLASYLHDLHGSYDLALSFAMPISLLASLLVFTLGRYPELSPAR